MKFDPRQLDYFRYGADVGVDVRARHGVSDAEKSINALHRSGAGVEKLVNRLLELDCSQAQEIARLQSVVYVLMQMLVESGTLSSPAIDERIRTAFQQLEADPHWNALRGAD